MNNDEGYSVVLQNSRKKSYIRLGFAMVIMNAITFLLFLFFKNTLKTGIIGLIGVIVYFLIKRWEAKRNPETNFVDESAFFLLAAIWVMQSIIIGLLIFITGWLFKISLQPFRFIFTPEYIHKDFYPARKYEWNLIDSVVLKSGVLTINFKNDRLIQGYTEKCGSIDEKDFNDIMEKFRNPQ